MKIISISGLDGSGKSTQAKLLQDYLESRGKKIYYFHAVQFSLPQAIKAFKKKLLKQQHKIGSDKGVTEANWIQLQLRKFAFLVDIVRFHFLKKKLAKLGYDFVITDRFFYDTIVNLAYLMNKNTPPSIEKYMPHADTAFYLKVQPEVIMSRDRVPEQGIGYLVAKKRLYDMYSIIWDLKVIDGSADREILFNKIIQQLNVEQN